MNGESLADFIGNGSQAGLQIERAGNGSDDTVDQGQFFAALLGFLRPVGGNFDAVQVLYGNSRLAGQGSEAAYCLVLKTAFLVVDADDMPNPLSSYIEGRQYQGPGPAWPGGRSKRATAAAA